MAGVLTETDSKMKWGALVLGTLLLASGLVVMAEEAAEGGSEAPVKRAETVLQWLCRLFCPRGASEVAENGPLQIPPPTYEETPSVGQVVYTLGHDILAEYRTLEPDNNVVFSPVSIAAALSLVYSGAAGQTRELMDAVLGFKDGTVPTVLLGKDSEDLANSESVIVANRAFFADGLTVQQSFIGDVGEGNVETLPFSTDPESAVAAINDFVSTTTEGLIPEIVTSRSVNSLTDLVLVNAIFFKGTWKYQFPKDKIKKAEFRGIGGPSEVEFMSYSSGVELFYGEMARFDSEIVGIPYKGDRFVMYIILPKTDEGWKVVEEELSGLQPTFFQLSANSEPEVLLTLPKWEIDTDMSTLTEIFQKIGLGHLFSIQADYTNMVEGGVQLSEVLHKAKIQVTEEGTEAAAATAVVSSRSAVSFDDPKQVVVDHPFLYYVMDLQDNTILFQGTVTNL